MKGWQGARARLGWLERLRVGQRRRRLCVEFRQGSTLLDLGAPLGLGTTGSLDGERAGEWGWG